MNTHEYLSWETEYSEPSSKAEVTLRENGDFDESTLDDLNGYDN
jgi:hypothetical protein